MKYTLIKAHCITAAMAAKHFAAAYERLPESDKRTAFESLLNDLQENKSTWYHLRSDNVDLHMVTRVTADGGLIIDAMQGKGMLAAAPDIIRRARGCGYNYLAFETVKQGMRKMLARHGFEVVKRFDGGATLHKKKLGVY